MKTIILGKKSYLSNKLKKVIINSKVYSLNEDFVKKLDLSNCNIIINSFYSSLKLDKIDSYQNFIKRSLYDLSIFLDRIKGKNVRKIIYTSSSSTYNLLKFSNFNNINFRDERNRYIYSSTKLNAESLIKNFCTENNIKFCVVRIFNIFGEGEKFSIISKITDAYKNKKKILNLVNNGNSIRDFIHINEVVNIYKKIIIKNNYNVVDVASGYGTRIRDIIKFLGKENFIIKNKTNKESKVSIGYNSIINRNEKYSLEKYIKQKLSLKKQPKFERFL
ncbi:NAD(P)-dependent oxidoreductase [Pelagibacterales bacterium SAG-MED22]|nr:NAD(P)-dependent oxidoreductase [Pelagibacterales bacterium SAG-MED22]